jgi:hypothetical protein
VLSTGSRHGDSDTAACQPPTPERQAARAAGLRYVDDTQPGISRRRAGKGFSYRDADGHAMRDAATLQRIRALAIPPAYTAVWICAHANGHLQATGRDARGRKQYRYHADWAKERDAGKFDRIIAFGEALPALRRRLSRDLKRQGFPRKRCWRWWSRCWPTPWCGSAMKPMPTKPFVWPDHAAQPPSGPAARRPVRMRFRGKSGQLQEVTVGDRRLGTLVRGVQQLPGQALFQYRDDDGAHPAGRFRCGQRLPARGDGRGLHRQGFPHLGRHPGRGAGVRRHRTAGTGQPARAGQGAARGGVQGGIPVGQYPAVCRKAYIDPCVFAGWERGELANWPACVGRASGNRPPCACCAGRAGSAADVSRNRSR